MTKKPCTDVEIIEMWNRTGGNLSLQTLLNATERPVSAPPTRMPASREEFETWASTRGLPIRKTLMDKYVDETTNWCWQTWIVAHGLNR